MTEKYERTIIKGCGIDRPAECEYRVAVNHENRNRMNIAICNYNPRERCRYQHDLEVAREK